MSSLARGETISDGFSVALEQYMTIAIPGTVIDTREMSEGGTYIYGAEYSAFPPLQVRQAEAHLVDNLCPLSNVMVRLPKTVPRGFCLPFQGRQQWEKRFQKLLQGSRRPGPEESHCQRRQPRQPHPQPWREGL